MRWAGLALAGLLLGGCTQQLNTVGPKGVPLVIPDQLTVCTHLSFAPFQSVSHGKIVGFDVDLIDLVAHDLGLPQKIIDTSFEGIQSGAAYDSNQCDIGTGGMTITAVRKQNLDFSEPYLDAKQGLLSRSAERFPNLAALRGKRVGVLVGTTGETYVRKWDAEHGKTMKIVQFDEMTLQLTGVKTRQVDAAVMDTGPVVDFAKQNGGLALTGEIETHEQLGFGVRKGNNKMREEINRMLDRAHADGTYEKLVKKWFTTSD